MLDDVDPLKPGSIPELTDITSLQALAYVGHLIENLIQQGHEKECDPVYRKFWLKNVPTIAVPAYLHRFHRYCPSSAATYLTAGSLLYMTTAVIPLSRRNAYRLFSAAYIVAVKLVEDKLYSMKRYATTSGLSKTDLAQLEILLLDLVQFQISDDRDFLINQLSLWGSLPAAEV